jgi:hypothetical protein
MWCRAEVDEGPPIWLSSVEEANPLEHQAGACLLVLTKHRRNLAIVVALCKKNLQEPTLELFFRENAKALRFDALIEKKVIRKTLELRSPRLLPLFTFIVARCR